MAPVKHLSDQVKIGAVTARNRICIPPMVFYGHAGEDGMVTDAHVAHYREFAAGGAGLIIQEATCIAPEGRLRPDQLGIWSDEHIPGLRRIAEAVHETGCPIFLQIHHRAVEDPGALTMTEMEALRDAFIAGSLRAFRAGYDGIELHGCHSYLLCQMLNRRTNPRTDRYADGVRLVEEIYQGVRSRTPPEFVIGIRLGGFEPALSDGIAHAKAMEEMGLEFLDISYGFAGAMEQEAPGNPDFSAAVRAAYAISRAVTIPVFAVDGIRTPEQARSVLEETGVDMVDIGRSAMVDPDWPRKALAGQTPGRCLDCKTCQWRIDASRCPGRKALQDSNG